MWAVPSQFTHTHTHTHTRMHTRTRGFAWALPSEHLGEGNRGGGPCSSQIIVFDSKIVHCPAVSASYVSCHGRSTSTQCPRQGGDESP